MCSRYLRWYLLALPPIDNEILFYCVLHHLYADCWPPYAASLMIETARDRSTGELLSRVLYNEVEVPILGSSDNWISYERVMSHLQRLTISTDEYKLCCSPQTESVDDIAASESLKDMDKEIKATISSSKL